MLHLFIYVYAFISFTCYLCKDSLDKFFSSLKSSHLNKGVKYIMIRGGYRWQKCERGHQVTVI